MVLEAQADRSEERQASVFISYSREDKDFVYRLDQALAKRERETWVDLEDIRPTEEWLASVYAGIEGTNAFVFVISPESVNSKSCLQELNHAVAHNKRLIPIVRRDVDASTVPEPLRSPQWIFFRDADNFEDSFQELVDALDTDLDWVHAHTRLLTRAIEWDANRRDKSFVLRGSDLRTAEEWQVRAADKEPKLTPLQTEYLLASRGAERRRQRLTLGAVTFGLIVAVALAVLFLLARNEAERQADIALSRQLAAQAQLAAEQEPQPLQRSVLLALEARKQSPLLSFEADQVLRDALTLLPRPVASLSHEENVNNVVFSPDGKYLATASATHVEVWEVSSHDEVARWLHEGGIVSIAFDSDGQYLYVVTFDKMIQVWNVATGEEVGRVTITLEGSEQPTVQDARFSPNFQYLYLATSVYSASSESAVNTIRVWDPATGKEIARMEGGTNVAFSENGKYLATGGDETVQVLDMSSREEVARVTQEGGASVALSPGGEYLATVENSRTGTSTARVWETSSGEEVTRVTQESPAGTGMNSITDVVLSRGGKYLGTQSSDRTVRIWDTASGKEVARVTHEDDIRHMIMDVAFSPDGEYLATAGADDLARVWDLTSTREFVTMTNEADVEDVAFSPDSRYVATSADETVRVWDPSTGDEVAHMEGTGDVVFSPDSEHLAAQSSDGTVSVWETSSGKEITRVPMSQWVNALAFSPDGEYLTAVGTNGTVRVWDSHSGEEAGRITLGDSVQDVAFSPDGRYLAIAGTDPTVRVLDMSSREEVARVKHDNDPYEPGDIADIAFSPDSEYLATASDDRTVRVWDPNSGEEVARMDHDDGVKMLAFSPDGKYLATASGRLPMIRESGESYTAHIWNLSSGEEVARMTHDNVINMVAFIPGGEYLATASDDTTARVWEVFSGAEVARMTHDNGVQDVAISPDGRYLAAASAGTTRAWLWRRPEDLSEEACTRLTRNFTEKEWQQYLGEEPYRKTCPSLPKPA